MTFQHSLKPSCFSLYCYLILDIQNTELVYIVGSSKIILYFFECRGLTDCHYIYPNLLKISLAIHTTKLFVRLSHFTGTRRESTEWWSQISSLAFHSYYFFADWCILYVMTAVQVELSRGLKLPVITCTYTCGNCMCTSNISDSLTKNTNYVCKPCIY